MSIMVLVVYKKSQYQIYVNEKENQHIKALLEAGDISVAGMKASHEANQKTLETILEVLERQGYQTRTRCRADASMVKDDDLVISVGGDGTFLWTQKYVGKDIPVFGVNSDPGRSVGYLCTADASNFEERLKDYMDPEEQKTYGWPMARPCQRIRVAVNGETVLNRVMNDVLFCHKNPAATSSYILNGESQKSSGVWICTATGSSAAMKSCGGKLQAWHDPNLQYRVREPYNSVGKYKNSWGFLERGEEITFVSKMRESILAPDGARSLIHIKMGDRITVSHSDEPLTWIKL